MSNRMLLRALVAAASVASVPALAQEGNGEPFLNRTPGTTAFAEQQVTDVGSDAYTNVTGRPGTQLMVASADLVTETGSEALVQTANSLPVGAAQGATAYVQLRPATPSLAVALANSTRPRG